MRVKELRNIGNPFISLRLVDNEAPVTNPPISTDDIDVPQQQVIFNRYKLSFKEMDILGEGGYGKVFKGQWKDQ